jgi:hypothetical protein
MSLELVNTLATFGTFLVIAGTAIAAIHQLRHARSSNHIAALTELRETTETPGFQAAEQFVNTQLRAKLGDPAFRYQLLNASARTNEMLPFITKARIVANFFEGIGMLVKTGVLDSELVIQIYADRVTGLWEQLAPFVALGRRRVGDALLENFEYLVVLAQDWLAAHPKGTYPAGLRRIQLKDQWLDADKQYAASLAPA